MISMLHAQSVRPSNHQGEGPGPAGLDDSSGFCKPCVEDSLLFGEDDDVDTDLALLDDPIVGVGQAASNKDG